MASDDYFGEYRLEIFGAPLDEKPCYPVHTTRNLIELTRLSWFCVGKA